MNNTFYFDSLTIGNDTITIDWNDVDSVYKLYRKCLNADYFFVGIDDGTTVYVFRFVDFPTKYLRIKESSEKFADGTRKKCLRFELRTNEKKDFIKEYKHLALYSFPFKPYDNERKTQNFKNRGEFFEKICTENNGETWSRNNESFDKKPDLVVNIDGKEVNLQIKYYRCTLCNSTSLYYALDRKLNKKETA